MPKWAQTGPILDPKSIQKLQKIVSKTIQKFNTIFGTFEGWFLMIFEAKMKPIFDEKFMSIYHRMQAARFAKILKKLISF